MWNVLKWVLAALAAGFVGQFGKSFALHLMQRRRAQRAEQLEQPKEPDEGPREVRLERERLDAEAKTEKKRAKAELKRIKKSGKQHEEGDD